MVAQLLQSTALAKEKQEHVVITNYDYSNVQWERGSFSVGPPNSDMLVTLNFAYHERKLTSLDIHEGKWTVDLSKNLIALGDMFPTRIQIRFNSFDARGGADDIGVALPFQPIGGEFEGQCFAKTFEIEHGKLIKESIAKASPVRCEY
jgi:hypothetical protein